MPTELLTRREPRVSSLSSSAVSMEEEELRAAVRRQFERVRRLKLNVAAWLLGSILITTLWVLNQWQANGAFQHFGSHEGNRGDWNPTLWALAVGGWGLFVGINALRVHFERPATKAEMDREFERLKLEGSVPETLTNAEVRRLTRMRLDRVRRLRFHAVAWVFGMVVLTPLWALIEWQDNGGFERWSNNSRSGSWEPWILYVAAAWALVIAVMALRARLDRPAKEAEIKREVQRLRSSH